MRLFIDKGVRLGVISLLVFGFLGCAPKSQESAKTSDSSKGTPTASIDFQTTTPRRTALIRKVEQPGTVEPFEETQIFAKVPGFVSRVNADIGQRVKGPVSPVVGSLPPGKTDALGGRILLSGNNPPTGSPASSPNAGAPVQEGEILAEVSIPEMEEEAHQKMEMVALAETEVVLAQKSLASTEAQVASMEALVQESKAGVRRAQAQFERWESESARVAGLIQRGIADAQTRDQILSEFRSASANRDEAMAKLVTAEANARKAGTDREKAKAGILVAQAQVGVAKSEAKRLQAMLGYTKIRAPYNGIITRRKVNTGDFLAPGRVEPLFTISRIETLRLVVFVPEADAGLVKKDTPILLRVQALKGWELKGIVSRTSWSLDPGARTLRAEIDVPNPGEMLRPGMYVYATLEGTLPENWAIPNTALAKQGENLVCFRDLGGKIARTVVQVGHSDGKLTEILKWQTAPDGAWNTPDGNCKVCIKSAGLADGMPIPSDK